MTKIPDTCWLESLTASVEKINDLVQHGDTESLLRALSVGVGLLLAREIDRLTPGEIQPAPALDPRQTMLFPDA